MMDTAPEPKYIYLCRCCAFPYTQPIEKDSICICCGFQEGVDNDISMGEPAHKISQRWILGGMRWWSETIKPPSGWNPEEQQLPWLIEAYSSSWTGESEDE